MEYIYIYIFLNYLLTFVKCDLINTSLCFRGPSKPTVGSQCSLSTQSLRDDLCELLSSGVHGFIHYLKPSPVGF